MREGEKGWCTVGCDRVAVRRVRLWHVMWWFVVGGNVNVNVEAEAIVVVEQKRKVKERDMWYIQWGWRWMAFRVKNNEG